MAGTTYVFGAISPVTKARLGYDQRQVAALGVAKEPRRLPGPPRRRALGREAGVGAGAAQNSLGYGWLWLIVDGRAPALPISMVSVRH